MSLRVFSYGGGVQSTAALVLAATGKIDYKTFLFCNVGEDSEHPDTLKYVRDVAVPYATANGITVEEVYKTRRGGERDGLLQLVARTKRSIPIPVRMSNGAPGNRTCTFDFKIQVVRKWIKAHGATKENPALKGLGISWDESQRMRASDSPLEVNDYPLVDMRLKRADCVKIIEEAGIPIPPKSSCYFCPYHRTATWVDMKRRRPDLFQKSVELETMLNVRRGLIGRDAVYLTRAGVPMGQINWDQGDLFDADDSCESGHCMT